MALVKTNKIEHTLNYLLNDSKNDKYKVMKGLAKSMFRPMEPRDFKEAYLSISKAQGEYLVQLISENELKNIVEFGTSFGISTLYLAQGALATNGKIITTELITSKAQTAINNFEEAGVNELIEVRVGNAMETLKNYEDLIDLLFLDGWKDLYLPLFQMLEPNFHRNTVVYVDNADMKESLAFLEIVAQTGKYNFKSIFDNKVVLITVKN